MSGAAGDSSYVNKIDCEVVDYQLINSDPSLYNNHIFMIKVWIQKHMYAIDRSYAAFCDLDARLRKQYARSNIPHLKLAGASITTKLINSTNNLKESKKTLTFPPESEGERNELKPLKRVESSEIIAQKKKYLTSYLQGLLKIPEIVLSDILLLFLDEESTHGEPVSDAMDEQSDAKEIHILLRGMEMTTRMVRLDRQQEIAVPPNHFVAWSFNTLSHDVGFSISYQDKEILKYQRYDSHQKLIMGHFEMPEAGTVRFIWDNSYSRWRSKTVNYVIKVVCPEEYLAAQATAAQMKKDKLLFLKQRGMVKTALVALSTNILSARGNSIAATAIPAASTTLLSTSTSSPMLVGSGGSGRSGDDLKRTSSAKDVNTANTTSNTGNTSLGNTTHTTPATTPTNASNTTRTTDPISNTNTNTNTNSTTISCTTSYWEFADMSEAVREINRLRNEKKTLQQALSESETALVTERSIAAQVITQYDSVVSKKNALESELGELKSEFDVFRENYFNEMESKLAETLATFELHHSAGGGSGGSKGGSGKHTGESGTRARQGGGAGTDALTAAPTAQSLFGVHDATDETGDSAAHAESTGATVTDGSTTDTITDTTDASLNQLINLTPQELSHLATTTLAAHYTQLNTYTQTMLKRGYLTKDMENMLSRLKNEKRQLKTYAIQMKTNLDSLTLRYIHLDQDRAVLLNQVKELKDIVVLLETDRKGLREHISLLAGGSTSMGNTDSGGADPCVVNVDGKDGGDRADSGSSSSVAVAHGTGGDVVSGGGSDSIVDEHAAVLARTQSNASAESSNSGTGNTSSSHTAPQITTNTASAASIPTFNSWVKHNTPTTNHTTTNTNTTSTTHPNTTHTAPKQEENFSISMWLNSGLASASAAMSFDAFDFGESHYYSGGTSGGGNSAEKSSAVNNTSSSRNVRSSKGILSHSDDADTATNTSTATATRSNAADTAHTSTIIISMEDLQQATLQSTTTTINNNTNSTTMHATYTPDDTGSDCGYSVYDEEQTHMNYSTDPLHRADSNTSNTSSSSTTSANDKHTLASGSGDSGGFTKVTEQLYGILPTWGQIQKLRSSSLI